MSDIANLYQEIILDHSRSPKNFGRVQNKTHQALGNNPLCGDTLSLELRLNNNLIEDIAFIGDGCAISKASASLMTEFLKNKEIAQAQKISEDFHNMLTNDSDAKDLGKLLVLKGVKQFPMRVKCATLCWHTLKAAMNNKLTATTEN